MLLANGLRRLGHMSTCLTVLTAETVLWFSGVLPKCLTVLTAATVLWVSGVMSISKAFLLLLRVIMANKSRLILVGAAVSFVRVLPLATVVVIFSTVARVMADTSTELLHSTL